MAVDGVSPTLGIRSSVGIELWASLGPKLPYEYKVHLPREETKNSRSISFSPDGRYFAYSNGTEIKVLRTSDWHLKCTFPRPKAFYLKFSPRGNYLCTWELYTVTKDKPEGAPNMFVYELETGTEMFSTVQKKQTDWEPSWSANESVFAMMVGGEAHFYDLGEEASGFRSTSRKIGGSRNGMLSLSPGNSPPFVALYTPGAKGAPSMCKLFKYPALEQNQAIACKSFFQADRVEMLWNKRGTGLLLLTCTDVDKSGASYYGNQALHFMATRGESCSVPLSKSGPVHCVKWNPKAAEFIVVYGFMPSKATLYNLKCDVVFDFGEGPRNCAYFNPFGNIVLLAGFGNLPGNVEIWDVKMKEKIADIRCPDTTFLDWNPNGEYFLTATTAPRLRISNGFKVYHYSGALVHETMWAQGQELLGVEWQQFPENTFTEQPINKVKQEGIKSSQPEVSKKVYTPPHLRLISEGKNPEKYVPHPSTIPEMPLGNSPQSNRKGQGKTSNPKSNKSKTKDKDSNTAVASSLVNGTSSSTANIGMKVGSENSPRNQNLPEQEGSLTTSPNKGEAVNEFKEENENIQLGKDTNSHQQQKKAGSSDREKKIRNVSKKLSDIKKLKARQDNGETLELNQVNKISMEAKFLDELKALKLST